MNANPSQSMFSPPARGGTRRALPVLAAAVLAAFTGLASGLARADAPSPVVYVESNNPEHNTLLAYTLDNKGELTLMPGAPYDTHGKGVFDSSLKLGPFDADQIVVTNPERTLLYAVNAGSNTIAAFHILPDGSLYDVEGSPFPSGGSNPVSIGLSRDTLVVVNKANDPAQPATAKPSYVSFRIRDDGSLEREPRSVVRNVAASPSQALISPDGRTVFSTDFLGAQLESLRIGPTGNLIQNTPQPVNALAYGSSTAPRLPLGLAVNPRRPVLYVGLVTVSKVAVYTFDDDGGLHYVTAVANSGAGVCWIRSNAAGTRLYTMNTGDTSITVYDTSDALNPVQLQNLPLVGDPASKGSGFQIELSPDQHHLFGLTQRAGTATTLGEGGNLHALDIADDGTLSEKTTPIALPIDPDKIGIRPFGLATF